MEIDWQMIRSDDEYAKFRSSVRDFLVRNEMSPYRLTVLSGVGRKSLSTILYLEKHKVSFKTVAKLMNFMDNYKK